MHSKSILISTLLASILPASAFTNGTLVPSYLCRAQPDGLPKSFGQLLPFTREQTPTVAFSQNAGQNVKAPALQQQNGAKTGNSAYILASFHDSPNSLASLSNGARVQTKSGGPIVAGQANELILSSGTDPKVGLKGMVLVGADATGQRQGGFEDRGGKGTFVPFRGCGRNAQGGWSGVIQQTGISATNTFTGLVYNAPACIPGNNLTIAGLSVTGKGFGTYSNSFQVQGSRCDGQQGKVPAASAAAAGAPKASQSAKKAQRFAA